MKYLFGDTDLAAKRLKVLAEVFVTSSRPFLKLEGRTFTQDPRSTNSYILRR